MMGSTHGSLLTGWSAEQVLDMLEDWRKRLCQYGIDGYRCDCKFWSDKHSNAEFSGCAELRTAITKIQVLRDYQAQDGYVKGFADGRREAAQRVGNLVGDLLDDG